MNLNEQMITPDYSNRTFFPVLQIPQTIHLVSGEKRPVFFDFTGSLPLDCTVFDSCTITISSLNTTSGVAPSVSGSAGLAVVGLDSDNNPILTEAMIVQVVLDTTSATVGINSISAELQTSNDGVFEISGIISVDANAAA